ncbi:MAG: Major Facilitator Superfamily protein [Methanosaeta sp. PtaB.Bin039]|nr:MAG: Major Facilitator Superfamily protein [Methanosaeta sp. PtaB.Bin039]HOT05969.1 MFS transporter [Methanotrichaceae archaeon]HQF16827.1 MFS transporter [Methanotrichaceae archaeon]HQI90153.1 MFS transporter [Methanotrichaceae archaeon]HQJ29125.1 MFS transporter [Methanotrichaceae archaeon]
MNRTQKLLLISDLLVLTGFGLVTPILAIYINDVQGGDVLAAGLASTLFLLTKSLVQLPFSQFIDRRRDKARWLLLGTGLITIVPMLYIFIDHIYQVFLAEILYGLGSGLAYPTWMGLWSANLNKGQEGFEWSVYSTATGLGTAATAAAGAALASIVGFTSTFVFTSLMCALGSGILLILEREGSEG